MPFLLPNQQRQSTEGTQPVQNWMVICLERDAELHIAQLMLLPLTVSCFSKIKIGFTFLVPAHPGRPGQRAVKRVCECVLILNIFRHIWKTSALYCVNMCNFSWWWMFLIKSSTCSSAGAVSRNYSDICRTGWVYVTEEHHHSTHNQAVSFSTFAKCESNMTLYCLQACWNKEATGCSILLNWRGICLPTCGHWVQSNPVVACTATSA